MRTCVMLDVDGVVVNGRPSDGRFWSADIHQDLGVAPEKLADGFFRPHWTDIVLGRRDLHTVLQDCLPRIAPGVTADALIDYWFAMDARLDQGVLSRVSDLRDMGFRVYLATNQEHRRARYLMTDLGLAQHVDGMVYSAAIGARKPDQRFFAACAAQTEALASDLILVDDTPANVLAAQAMGWRAHVWSGGDDLIGLVTGE